MHIIDNTMWNTKLLLECGAITSITLLAGSKRLVHYFPGTTMRGLLLHAGASSAACYAYAHHLSHPEHTYLDTLLRKITLIATASLCTTLSTTALQRYKISLSPRASMQLTFLDCLIGMAAIGTPSLNHNEDIPHKTPPPLTDYSHLSREVIETAKQDPDVLNTLIGKFERCTSNSKNQIDEIARNQEIRQAATLYSEFFRLDSTCQNALQQLFATKGKADLLPHPITDTTIQQAKTNSVFANQFKAQFQLIRHYDWGFFSLTSEIQCALKDWEEIIVKQDSTYLFPIQITSQLIQRIKAGDFKISKLRKNITDTLICGFESLSFEDQVELKYLVMEHICSTKKQKEVILFPLYKMNEQLIDSLNDNQNLQDTLFYEVAAGGEQGISYWQDEINGLNAEYQDKVDQFRTQLTSTTHN